MRVIGFTFETTKVLFGMCDCTFNSEVSYLLLVLGSLHICGQEHVRSHVSPDMYCEGSREEEYQVEHWGIGCGSEEACMIWCSPKPDG